MQSIVTFFIFIIFLSSCKTDESVRDSAISSSNKLTFEEFKQTVSEGDIVLKRGKGPISQTIVKTLMEKIPLSHCAIVVGKNDSLTLVNSISGTLTENDGLQYTSLNQFYSDALQGSIFILRAKDRTRALEIQDEALRLYAKNIPFDHDFDHTDSTKLYCSEFVENVLFKVYSTPFFGEKERKNKTILTFNEILYHDSLVIVNQ